MLEGFPMGSALSSTVTLSMMITLHEEKKMHSQSMSR